MADTAPSLGDALEAVDAEVRHHLRHDEAGHAVIRKPVVAMVRAAHDSGEELNDLIARLRKIANTTLHPPLATSPNATEQRAVLDAIVWLHGLSSEVNRQRAEIERLTTALSAAEEDVATARKAYCAARSEIERLRDEMHKQAQRLRADESPRRVAQSLIHEAFIAGHIVEIQEAPDVALSPDIYFIRNRGLFFRPGALGYTNELGEAGRFSKAETERYRGVDELTIHHISEYAREIVREIAEHEAAAAKLYELEREISAIRPAVRKGGSDAR